MMERNVWTALKYTHIFSVINITGVHFGGEKLFQCKMKNHDNLPPCAKMVPFSEVGRELWVIGRCVGILVWVLPFTWCLSLKSLFSAPTLGLLDLLKTKTNFSFFPHKFLFCFILSFWFFSFVPVIGFFDSLLQDLLIFIRTHEILGS